MPSFERLGRWIAFTGLTMGLLGVALWEGFHRVKEWFPG